MGDRMARLNQRPIPPAALEDPDAVEMLRVWIASEGLHCSIKVGMYVESTDVPEEAAWGKILADTARHVARALSTGYAQDPETILEGIRARFLEELDSPTSDVEGDFFISN
ncbi:MAG: DUF5076 domain-containing protein [Deltaproteobacteria bacterium]|nr:DUF5076 domain-containing protein [Deltaproteobacteria bacterium]